MAIFNSFLYVYQAGYHCYKTPVVDEPRVNYPTHQAPAAVRLPGPGRPRGRCSAMGIPHDGQDTSMLYRLYVGCVIPHTHTHIITYNHIYIYNIYIYIYILDVIFYMSMTIEYYRYRMIQVAIHMHSIIFGESRRVFALS